MVFFTPCGEPFTQHVAERLLKSERLLFVCSRYEASTSVRMRMPMSACRSATTCSRAARLPAMVVADAVVRLIPGALVTR